MNEILNAKEIERKLPDLRKRREGLQKKLSEEQTKGKALQDKLEDKTLDLFDRAVRALKGGESIKAKNQILYSDLQISEKVQKDLIEELTELDENIQILDSERRKTQVAQLSEEVKKVLSRLQETQVAQFQLLTELAAKRDEIESNIGVHFVDRRTDFVKVRITDEVWRSRRLPQISQSLITPMGKKPNEGIGVNPIYSKKPIFEFFLHERAIQLQNQGKVAIEENSEKPPTYERVCVRDPEPLVLRDLESLNLGIIVTVEGKKLPFFSEIEKEVGWCQLDLNLIKTLRR